MIYSLVNKVTFHVCDKLFIDNNKMEEHAFIIIVTLIIVIFVFSVKLTYAVEARKEIVRI